MRLAILIYIAAVVLLVPDTCHASLDRLLSRRQTGESEQESTTPKSQPEPGQPKPAPAQSESGNGGANQPGRLYPDLAQRPNFLPPFNAPYFNPQQQHQQQHQLPPFVPFNMPNRLNSDQQNSGPFGPRMLPPPRPVTPNERLQSQSFANGLGKRLLSLVGIEVGGKDQQANNGSDGSQGDAMNKPQSRSFNEPLLLEPLNNSTVLSELTKRLNMLMGGLSKMYNSTVQEQLGMLQERFKKETANGTNPWQQRVAQQVPMFFEQMAARVSSAQEHLNRVVRDLAQAAQGNGSVLSRAGPNQPQPGFFSGLDQFMNGPGGGDDFVNQIGRSLGFGQPNNNNNNQNQNATRQQLGERLREFWILQVQPQIGMLRNQMARTWQDLTKSGALTPDLIMRSRMQPLSGANGNNSDGQPSNDLVDSLLKEAESEASEIALIAPKDGAQSEAPAGGNSEPQAGNGVPMLSPQMQQRLAAMQRDLNQLWQGLTSSLMNAVGNVRNTLNPQQQRPGFGPFREPPPPQQQESDPRQNEISGKVQDLSRLQKEADVVYDAVQQKQREAQQQRPSFVDRFRSFMNNADMHGLNQLPDRIGDQFHRFSTAVGNFWVTIPERWDNMMSQRRNQEDQAKLRAQLDAKTSTAAPPMAAGENSAMSGN